MSLGWHCPTVVIVGLDGLSGWLADQPEQSVTVLADAAVVDGAIVSLVRDRLGRSGLASELVSLSGPGDLESVAALADRLAATDLVVGIGGGSLLDQAKLAALLRTNPAARARLAVAQRSGLLVLPHDLNRVPRLIAVPTTVGTGAELSPVACLNHSSGKRLIVGSAMQPDVAVVDPAATATLPDELVAEGVLEMLFRIAGVYVGDHHDLPTEDALARTMAELAVRYGNELRESRAAGHGPSDRLRTEIAKLSGLSHGGWTVIGREPFACRGWYVANELASLTGVRKMTAVAALLPPLWRAIDGGDPRWGSARRLRELWGRLRAAAPRGLPQDPARGIAALIDSWGIGRRIVAGAPGSGTPGSGAPEAEVLDMVARRSIRAWGAGLPMLSGLGTADIRTLVAEAAGADTHPDFRAPSRSSGRERG